VKRGRARLTKARSSERLASSGSDGGDYVALYKLTKRRSCWGPKLQTEHLRLRTLALLETSRYEECIRIGESSGDSEVSGNVSSCQHNLDKQAH
jgi:hypothetical protein